MFFYDLPGSVIYLYPFFSIHDRNKCPIRTARAQHVRVTANDCVNLGGQKFAHMKRTFKIIGKMGFTN